MSKDSGCMSGTVIGSIIRFFVAATHLLLKIIWRLIIYLGLWIPLLYITFGIILYFTVGFYPLDWHLEKWRLEGQLYISGLIACCLCSIIISIRNIIIKPISSIYKTPQTTEESVDIDQQSAESFVKKGRAPKKQVATAQRPSVYYSILEEDTLIHEYEDRFEIFKVHNNKARLERVEYKNEEGH